MLYVFLVLTSTSVLQLDGFLLWTKGILMFLFWIWSQSTIDTFIWTGVFQTTNGICIDFYYKNHMSRLKKNFSVRLLVSCSPYYFPTCRTADRGCSHWLTGDPSYIYCESYTEKKNFVLLQRIKEVNPRVMPPSQSEIWHWLYKSINTGDNSLGPIALNETTLASKYSGVSLVVKSISRIRLNFFFGKISGLPTAGEHC